MDYKLVEFYAISDERGSLVSLEGGRNIPFDIKRVYYIYNNSHDIVRGKHAHLRLRQVVVCVSGSCIFILDNGENREEIELNKPNIGLYIGKNIWREMRNFSKDCVLLVLADDYYDEKEYIRDYNEFVKVLG